MACHGGRGKTIRVSIREGRLHAMEDLDLDLDLGQLDLEASTRLKDLFLTAASHARSHDDRPSEDFLTGLASLMDTLQRAQRQHEGDSPDLV